MFDDMSERCPFILRRWTEEKNRSMELRGEIARLKIRLNEEIVEVGRQKRTNKELSRTNQKLIFKVYDLDKKIKKLSQEVSNENHGS
jgi:predicted nuclease with TOPRIM domain